MEKSSSATPILMCLNAPVYYEKGYPVSTASIMILYDLIISNSTLLPFLVETVAHASSSLNPKHAKSSLDRFIDLNR